MRFLADPAFWVFMVSAAVFAAIGAICAAAVAPFEGAVGSGFVTGYICGLWVGRQINELIGCN